MLSIYEAQNKTALEYLTKLYPVRCVFLPLSIWGSSLIYRAEVYPDLDDNQGYHTKRCMHDTGDSYLRANGEDLEGTGRAFGSRWKVCDKSIGSCKLTPKNLLHFLTSDS